MYKKILISLLIYIILVFVFYMVSSYIGFDEWLKNILINKIKTELHTETVNFFIINITSIILSDIVYDKTLDDDEKYIFWKEKYEALYKEIKIFLPGYIGELCQNNIYSSEKLTSLLTNLKDILPESDIDEINSISKNFVAVQEKYQKEMSSLREQMNTKK